MITTYAHTSCQEGGVCMCLLTAKLLFVRHLPCHVELHRKPCKRLAKGCTSLGRCTWPFRVATHESHLLKNPGSRRCPLRICFQGCSCPEFAWEAAYFAVRITDTPRIRRSFGCRLRPCGQRLACGSAQVPEPLGRTGPERVPWGPSKGMPRPRG